MEEKNLGWLSGYNKVQHSIGTEPFFVRQIKVPTGGDIQLGDEVPNVPIREFNVYYSSTNYSDPLLVLLNIRQLGDVKALKYVPDKYMLSKNYDAITWDIRRIGSSLNDTELEEVLGEIYSKNKLDVGELKEDVQKKLTDITKDLNINLSGNFPAEHGNSVGSYDSGGNKIYYKKFTDHGYTRIKQCYTLYDFTVQDIKFDGDHTIETSNLPLKDTPIKTLEVYYKDTSSTNDPLMIYILYGDYRQRWLYRYSGDLVWTLVGGDGPSAQSSMNEKDIIKILGERTIPRVSIDLTKTNGSYTPTGNTLTFTVSIEHNPASSGFFQFIHTRSENKKFRIIQITHNGDHLYGIYSEEVLASVSGFYPDYTPSDPTKLLMVEIVDKSHNYTYYYRAKNESKWVKLERKGTEKLENIHLRNQLEKLKKESSDGSVSELSSGSSPFNKPGAISGLIVGSLVLTLAAVLLVRRYRYNARIRLFKNHPLL
ncbi:hypothetical protein BEWA_047750 [Theileria equi strain WA]|uniref:Uncharacterized protein n=1 Tax=Theileria equi strain WA TaxID=1537102 RepID=L1LAL0_THEEQ|nr:hypothetical protein BEWA_047750 [Theileria equi strain WA]EKX72310.1 hypothetical protein BEWA_047750 [Theileria equi strain WA]|eukprot:XP_004831762.1 hypothetical protein BEWA_047750 [Theileria equi strain WA]